MVVSWILGLVHPLENVSSCVVLCKVKTIAEETYQYAYKCSMQSARRFFEAPRHVKSMYEHDMVFEGCRLEPRKRRPK